MASKRSLVSLKMIAREANLSIPTVSRILRGKDQCSEETRSRVNDVAARLRYRRNLLVQGIQSGRTQTIGVMLPLDGEFFGAIFSGINEALARVDYVPIVQWCHDELAYPGAHGDVLQTSVLQQIYRLIDRRVDGVILRSVDDSIDDNCLRAIWERGIPVVAVDRELENTQADFVGVDDHAIGRLAAEHLLALGHRRLGHIAGPGNVITSRHRREGFEAAVRDSNCGATCDVGVDFHYGIDKEPIAELLNRPNRPTAIFAANDAIAANVFDVAQMLGLSIPSDLSVVGVGNLLHSKLLRPKLTTFEEHPRECGRLATKLLMDRLDNASTPTRRIRMEPEFVVRGSTARAPANL